MGVTGLWKLIEPCGTPVPVETLEGKVLAVDISIWLHQVVKGFQDSKGSALNNAHLLGLFHRLCKLLYYRVRPVFIFDGSVPQLKRDTIVRRQQQRSKLSNEADRIQALLLQSLAKEKVVQQALGTNAEMLLKSPIKRTAAGKSNKTDEDDLFKLPELPTSSDAQIDEGDCDLDDQDYASGTSDSSFDESNARHTYNASLQAIDVRSQHFKILPADVRHEILTDIKETRKQSSWGRLHELPARSDDFCSFQMKRLLKRRAVQESLEQAQQEMGGHTLTYAELSEFFSEEGIVTPTAIEQSTRQISSDEHTRFLLVRDLKKKASEGKQNQIQLNSDNIKRENNSSVLQSKKSSSAKTISTSTNIPATSNLLNKKLGEEYDADLEMALALSLEDSNKVYDEKDYEYDSDQDLRLNREQSKNLRHAAKGPARSYMIEYGGMNDEEVDNILEPSQLNDTQSLESFLNKTNVDEKICLNDIANDSIEEIKQLNLAIKLSKKSNSESLQKTAALETINSDTDSDLEEVFDAKTCLMKQSLEICVGVKDKLSKVDDLFADVFENEHKLMDESSRESDEVVQAIHMNKFGDSSSLETLHVSSYSLLEKNKCPKIISNKNIADKTISINDNVVEEKNILQPQSIENNSVENINACLPEEKEKPNITSSILDELKRQTSEVKNIKLESVKLSNSMAIDISSDEDCEKATTVATYKNVIELCDSETEIKRLSPNKTPSKTKSISDYFETTYKIKRSPEKPKTQVTPPVSPMVPKPYFVKRTPKSGRKRNGELIGDDVSPKKKLSKAAKSLFDDSEEQDKTELVTSEDYLKDAADVLKTQKTAEELETMATNLAHERRELETERNRQDRMGMSISQRMSNDCQELLRLFGIPYIVAPMEAEAQCAFLNAVEITNGTITDDSDIWLFGGRTVYKNFFAQNKHVLEFRAEQIEQTFNCNRDKLIQLACLVGSDYTTGIHGIGTVTALEILASFSTPTADATSSILSPSASRSGALSTNSVLSTLEKFRDWWKTHKNTNIPIGSSTRLSLRKKLKNIELHDGFPSSSVVEAYISPKVDENRDTFSWGSPDIDSIREFARKSFGWTTSKTDDILMPVIKKINEKKIQGSILNYFTAKSALRVQQPKVSKRVQTAIDKMSGKIQEEPSQIAKRTSRRARKSVTLTAEAQEIPLKVDTCAQSKRVRQKVPTATQTTSAELPSTSNTSVKQARCGRIPNTREVIPQRERDFEQMQLNKAKAAIILRSKSKASQ